MAGTRRLRCNAFIEAKTFEGSKQILKNEVAARGESITDRQIDDRLEAMEWALERGDSENCAPIGTRSLWVYVMPGAYPELRVYLRPRPELRAECELLWIEERLD
jgi:hypothetical protein